MAGGIGTPAFLSDGAPLLPENCWYPHVHFFGLHMNNMGKAEEKKNLIHFTQNSELLTPSTYYLVAHPLNKITEVKYFL